MELGTYRLDNKWRRAQPGVWRCDGPSETRFIYDATSRVLSLPQQGDFWGDSDADKFYEPTIFTADRTVTRFVTEILNEQ